MIITIILAIATFVCALGWFFNSIAVEALVRWASYKGIRPTTEEIKTFVRKVVNRRFGVT